MSFTRTDNGLSNLHLFYGSDLIVFVEGGKFQFSAEEILKGEGSDNSPDINFWNSLFRLFSFDRSVSFKAVGGKPTLITLANKILNNSLSDRAIVAMDSDYDRLRGRSLDHPRILYTYGYSWENDVWGQDQVTGYLTFLCCCQNLPAATIDAISHSYSTLFSKLNRLAILQMVYQEENINFFPSNFASWLDGRSDMPKFRKGAILEALRLAKKAREPFQGNLPTLELEFEVSGKLYKEWGFKIIQKFYKDIMKVTLQKKPADAGILGYCLSQTRFGLKQNQYVYYQNIFSDLQNSFA